MVYDIIIIGSGPAGYTAAIYCSRALLKTLLIAGYNYGGQLMLTTLVENFPGFPEGILGPELMKRMEEQAEKFGTEIIKRDVTKVDLGTKPFKIWVEDELYEAWSLIIATGARPRFLGVKGEKELLGRGVSTCAPCDAPFYKGKEVIVVGGGDSAMEEALELTKHASKVTIVHRRDQFRAQKILQERVFKNPKIEIKWSHVVEEIVGKNKVEGVILRDLKSNNSYFFKCDGVFIAIGYEPNTELFKGQVEMDEKGYIKVKEFTKTNIEGVFVAGEATDYIYRQAITAAGDGCKAALDAIKYIDELKSKKIIT
ncbi:MAG: thioredoxin-disulfide reductase [Thermoproteota archaeon]|jgi:thioredoxin reductase (NADPH)|nr:thioredoxin-disulfide reductase [Thermoproteota archaeon]